MSDYFGHLYINVFTAVEVFSLSSVSHIHTKVNKQVRPHSPGLLLFFQGKAALLIKE